MKLSASAAKKALKKKQAQSQQKVNILDPNFQLQTDFILDPSKLKALFATRRFGKSYTAGLYLFKEALENPGVSCLYIALTRDSAKKIIWKDIFKVLNRKFRLNVKFNETTLTATFPNGSVIYVMGVDSSEDEKDKLLGQKYKIAVIDECASFSIDLRALVYGTLKPAMADLNGTIVMIGTPGNLTKSLFFDITTGAEPGWHVIKADTHQNPYMKEKWEAEIAELIEKQPYITETPMYKQMYLGQWVVDTDKLVYKFSEVKNIYASLPVFQNTSEWQYILGVDLGYEDASGFVVTAFHPYDKILYILEAYKASKMDITDVATKINELKTRYDIHKIIVDGANKQAVEEIRKRHNIPLTPADKQGKEDFIEIMNSEFIQARIKLNKAATIELIDEYLGLVWKTRGEEIVLPKKEHPNCPNHLTDAALYAWRFCYSYLGQAPKQVPPRGTPEWAQQQVSEMEQAAEDFFRAQEEAEHGGWDW